MFSKPPQGQARTFLCFGTILHVLLWRQRELSQLMPPPRSLRASVTRSCMEKFRSGFDPMQGHASNECRRIFRTLTGNVHPALFKGQRTKTPMVRGRLESVGWYGLSVHFEAVHCLPCNRFAVCVTSNRKDLLSHKPYGIMGLVQIEVAVFLLEAKSS